MSQTHTKLFFLFCDFKSGKFLFGFLFLPRFLIVWVMHVGCQYLFIMGVVRIMACELWMWCLTPQGANLCALNYYSPIELWKCLAFQKIIINCVQWVCLCVYGYWFLLFQLLFFAIVNLEIKYIMLLLTCHGTFTMLLSL